MPKEVWFKHFLLTPIVIVTDTDTGEQTDEIQLGAQELNRESLPLFAANQWPLMWSSLREQFAQNPDLFQPMPPPIPNREQKRAAVRAAKKPGRTTPKQTRPTLQAVKSE